MHATQRQLDDYLESKKKNTPFKSCKKCTGFKAKLCMQ